MKRSNILSLVLIIVSCIACTDEITNELIFPNSLEDVNYTETNLNIPNDSSLIDLNATGLKCNVWLKGSGSRCGLVKDCNNVTYEETKKIGDRLAKSINEGTLAICKDLNCSKREFRNIKWSQGDCKKRILCVNVSYEFRCTKK